MRLLYCILFGFAFWILCWVLVVVAVFQLVLILISGQLSDDLRNFGRSLARYASQVVGFLTGARDSLPFPFADWPGSDAKSAGADLSDL
jgi:hypothetical protein